MQKQFVIYALCLFSLSAVILPSCQKGLTDVPKNTTTIPPTTADSTNNNTTDSTNNSADTVNKELPVLINASATNITATRATIGAEITADGGFQITEQGIVYDTLPNPTINSNILKAKTVQLGAFSLEIAKGLKPNTKYYARAYATNSAGTGYSKQVDFTIAAVQIGQRYGGGVVFYIDATTHHGLISALPGQNETAEWATVSVSVPGLKTEIGSGLANTKAILAALGDKATAAKFCDDLSSYGFTDWYMPSRDELAEMYKYRDLIGFNSAYRLSSSEADTDTAWGQSFGTDGSNGPTKISKTAVAGVRAIRAF